MVRKYPRFNNFLFKNRKNFFCKKTFFYAWSFFLDFFHFEKSEIFAARKNDSNHGKPLKTHVKIETKNLLKNASREEKGKNKNPKTG